jgi:predicted nucleotidyltransferase
MPDELEQNIFATICYYDILKYPLTMFEIWKYLMIEGCQENIGNAQTKIQLSDIASCLVGDFLKNKIENYQGFYFLCGQKMLVSERILHSKLSEQKYKRIIKVVRFLRAVPFVRMIGVTGRMAMKNAQEKSDLDLFIVLEKEHIFTGRILVTLATHILGVRRYGIKIANRICLNYFITTNSLKIETEDMFSSSEYFFIFPIFGFAFFQEFQRANNWIIKYHKNYVPAELPVLKTIEDSFLTAYIRKIGELFFGGKFWEEKLKKYQINRIMRDPRTKKMGSLIVANDDCLVFLPNPQGPKIFESFKQRLKEEK